jgi:hypothetical protein
MILFVAKSSPERTRVLRHVTDFLTVHRLVNKNPCWPRTSSTAAQKKPQHHRLQSPRSEFKSFFFLKQANGVKRAIQEAGRKEVTPPPPAEPEKVSPPPPAEPEKVPPPSPAEVLPPTPAKVKPPLPEEVKQPRRKVAR